MPGLLNHLGDFLNIVAERSLPRPPNAGELLEHFLDSRAPSWIFIGHRVDQFIHQLETTVSLVAGMIHHGIHQPREQQKTSHPYHQKVLTNDIAKVVDIRTKRIAPPSALMLRRRRITALSEGFLTETLFSPVGMRIVYQTSSAVYARMTSDQTSHLCIKKPTNSPCLRTGIIEGAKEGHNH